MNIKKAILYGILLWVLVFFEVSILMFGFNIQIPSSLYYITHMPIFAIIIAFVSLLYFKKEKSGLKNGFLLSLAFLATGIVLDSVITVPLFIKDYSFFIKKEMLIGFLEMVVVTMLIGAVKK